MPLSIMKKSLPGVFLIVMLSSCVWFSPSSDVETIIVTSDQISYNEWLELAKQDIRLFPKFGFAVKTSRQLEADQAFMASAIAEAGTRDSASRYYFLKACDYMEQKDLQTVMYRLNQAWLLNVKNPDVYRGFGWVYFQLKQYEMAIKLFDEGLSIDPNNHDLQSIKQTVTRELKENT